MNASELVDEKGLASGIPTRGAGEPAGSGEIADGIGTNNSDPSETNTGTIAFSAQDGLDSITVQGAGGPVTITGASVGTTIQGQFGVITITGVNFATGQITYSYTLSDNTSGDNTHDDFTIVVKDSDGDTATGTLRVNIIDDHPTAHNDTDSIVGNATSTDGNVITGADTTSGNAGKDVVGADDATVTGAHAGTNGAFTSVAQNGSGTLIHGTFGDLTIHDDGSYNYVLHQGVSTGGTEVFTYQLTDGDGDTSDATLTISFPNTNTIPSIGTAEDLSVDEDGLRGANPPGDPHGGNLVDSGQVVVQFGNDVPSNLLAAINLIDSSSLDTQLKQDGQPITFSLDGSGHLIGQVNGTGPAVVTIAITGATLGANGQVTYTYSVTLSDHVDNPLGDQTENQINLNNVQFQVTDSNGDHAPTAGHFNVAIFDDMPVTNGQTYDAGTVYEDGLTGHQELGPGHDGNDQRQRACRNGQPGGRRYCDDQPQPRDDRRRLAGRRCHRPDAERRVDRLAHHRRQLEGVLATDTSHVVFTVTDNPSDTNFTFTLLDNVDNDSDSNLATGEGDSAVQHLNLGGAFVATDTDGDHVVIGSGTGSIGIENDVPTPIIPEQPPEGPPTPIISGIVDEDDLPAGNNDLAPGDDLPKEF